MNTWVKHFAGSNNIHFEQPPLMSDGRNFAYWQPGAAINEDIRRSANITSNWDYRNYLTHNAGVIMETNQTYANNETGYAPVLPTPGQEHQTNSPYIFSSAVDPSRPYGYNGSDLKDIYLSRHQLQARMVAPSISQDQLLMNGYPRA